MDCAVMNALKMGEKIYVYGTNTASVMCANFLLENGIELCGIVKNSLIINKSFRNIPIIELDGVVEGSIVVAAEEKGVKVLQKEKKQHDLSFHIMEIPDIYGLYGRMTPEERSKTPKLEITATIGCKIACTHCPQKELIENYDTKKKARMMSLDLYKRCIDHMPAETVITFSGFVEPIQHPQWLDMIDYAFKTGHRVELFTTFSGITFEMWERIKDYPFEVVVLHAPDKKGYAHIVTDNEYWRVIRAAVIHKKSNGMPFVDISNCQSEPTEQFLEMIENRLMVKCELHDRAGLLMNHKEIKSNTYMEEKLYCISSYKQNQWVVLPNGDVTLCCNDFSLQEVLGNIGEQKYEDILRGEKYLSVRRRMMCLEKDNDIICRRCYAARTLTE